MVYSCNSTKSRFLRLLQKCVLRFIRLFSDVGGRGPVARRGLFGPKKRLARLRARVPPPSGWSIGLSRLDHGRKGVRGSAIACFGTRFLALLFTVTAQCGPRPARLLTAQSTEHGTLSTLDYDHRQGHRKGTALEHMRTQLARAEKHAAHGPIQQVHEQVRTPTRDTPARRCWQGDRTPHISHWTLTLTLLIEQHTYRRHNHCGASSGSRRSHGPRK